MTAGEYKLTDPAGNVTVFVDLDQPFRFGEFKRYTDAGGTTIEVTTEEWDGTQWQRLGVTYYRYYKAQQPKGFAHGLRFVLLPESYAKLAADPGLDHGFGHSS